MMTCGRLRRWQWQVASFSLLISLALGKSSPPPSPADLCSLVALAALSAMVSLTDNQLRTLMDTAGKLSLERRDVFLQRVGAMLRMRGHFTDADVAATA